MKTIEIGRTEMEKRISRHADLEPLPARQDPEIPLAAKDLIYSRKLLSVAGLDGDAEPRSTPAPELP